MTGWPWSQERAECRVLGHLSILGLKETKEWSERSEESPGSLRRRVRGRGGVVPVVGPPLPSPLSPAL